MKTKKLSITVIVFATLIFQFLTYNSDAQVCISPATNFASGNYPQSVISADFNGDQKIDLAVANATSELYNVSVFLGNGLGGFSGAANFSVAAIPVSIISADFNGDGKADLATANCGLGKMSIMLGDGTGNFLPPDSIPLIDYPSSIISADFNGDGKADLALTMISLGKVSIFLGDGLGGFNTGTNFQLATGCYPNSLISADFNGDGKADLAASSDLHVVSILLGNGLGSFGAVTNFNVGGNCQNYSLISADFNGDGKADLATTNCNNVSVLLGDGTGSFGATTNFVVGVFGIDSRSLTSSDFNGDGKADLAIANSNIVSNSNNVSILLGNGSGSFSSANNFIVGLNPYSIISADFTGDGQPDLITANMNSNNISVLINSPLPTVTANSAVTTVCAGASLILYGGGANSYTWTGGVLNNTAFIPQSTTTYTVTGVTVNGCSNTATKTITVNPIPTATFTSVNESSSLYCDGSIKAHLSGGTGTIQPQWLNSVQTVLASIDSVGALCSGIYTLNLSDVNNCPNTYIKTIQPGPIPSTPSLCLVTVDSTYTHNVLVWEKTNLDMTAIDSFIVYREITTNNYQPIGAVSFDSLSIFNDFNANPASTGYRYKLKSKNKKNVLSLFSNYHNTIHMTNTFGNFNWTPYQIENNSTPVSSFNIYRDDISNGNFQLIGNTTGNQFGYTDIQYSTFPNANYYVEAVMVGGTCNPTRTDYSTSRSNISIISNGIQQLSENTIINIYPNPANNTLNIKGITEKTVLRMYDIVGELVIEKEVENNTVINISSLTEGVYTLLMENKLGRSFNKVVISH